MCPYSTSSWETAGHGETSGEPLPTTQLGAVRDEQTMRGKLKNLLAGFPLLKIISVGGVTRVNTGCGGFYGCGWGKCWLAIMEASWTDRAENPWWLHGTQV